MRVLGLLRSIASLLLHLRLITGRKPGSGSSRKIGRSRSSHSGHQRGSVISQSEVGQPPMPEDASPSACTEKGVEPLVEGAPGTGPNQALAGRCEEYHELPEGPSGNQERIPGLGTVGEPCGDGQETNSELQHERPDEAQGEESGIEAVTSDDQDTELAGEFVAVAQPGQPGLTMSASDEENGGQRADASSSSEWTEVADFPAVKIRGDREGPEKEDGYAKPCPRCGVSCPPDEVQEVFGYRIMRWSAASGEVRAVRRQQSYCRRCRAEHAAEIRRRTEPDDGIEDQCPGDTDLDRAENDSRLSDYAGARPTVECAGVAGPNGDEEHLIPGPGPAQFGSATAVDQPHDPQGWTPDEASVSGVEPDAISDGFDILGETTGALTGSDAGEGESSDGAGTATPPAEPEVKSRTKRPWRFPPVYRPPAGGPPPRQLSPPRNHTSSQGESSSLIQPGRVAVRILFQRGGYCAVSLLASRPPGLPEQFTVSSGAGEVELLELQEDWYEAEVAGDLSDLLRTGFVWTDRETGQEWVLSGREVFVLASGTEHRGFVSCPRLVLGREHLVLCTAAQFAAVEGELRGAGCSGWSQLGEYDGVPAGWKLLRSVSPQRPVPPSNDNHIFNVLRPLPDIDIALEGGIRLTHNQWLLGYPPEIRIYGDPAHTGEVLIDGDEAVRSELGGYRGPGWDTEGDHQVWCGNTTKSYSLTRAKSSWEFWPAHSFSLPGAVQEGEKLALCGPVVWSSSIESHLDQRRAIQLPPNNSVLLGARPGELYFAYRRPDVRGAPCLGSPPFYPVWALPTQPLRGDKRRDRILLVGEPLAPDNQAEERQQLGTGGDVERWYQMILNAGRKGLAVEPESLATDQLWRSYKQLARRLWKLSR